MLSFYCKYCTGQSRIPYGSMNHLFVHRMNGITITATGEYYAQSVYMCFNNDYRAI